MNFKDIISNEIKEKRPNLSFKSINCYSSILFNLNKKLNGTNALSNFNDTTKIIDYLDDKDLIYKKQVFVCLNALTGKQEYYDKMVIVCKLFNQTQRQKKRTVFLPKAYAFGYVYCFSNLSYPNTYKVGYTTKTIRERKDELHSTGVIYPFKLEVAKKINNLREAEHKLHSMLDKYRVVRNREFFNVDLEKIKILFEILEGNYYNEEEEELAIDTDEELEEELDEELEEL